MTTIRFYPPAEIDSRLVDWLESQHMVALDSSMNGGLKDAYEHVRACIGPHRITHLWVLCEDDVPIGVAVIEQRHVNGLHLFVHPAYRHRGYGEQLLQQALLEDVVFYVFYTDLSRRLYQRYRLSDVAEADE
jgi:GNAT superfamily N-acetyltransferase